MPGRKKASERDAKASIEKSIREYGVNTALSGSHTTFYRKVSAQAVRQSLTKHGPVEIELRKEKIPKERDEAIEVVFVSNLEKYLDKDNVDLRSKFAYKNFEHRSTKKDNTERFTKRDFQ